MQNNHCSPGRNWFLQEPPSSENTHIEIMTHSSTKNMFRWLDCQVATKLIILETCEIIRLNIYCTVNILEAQIAFYKETFGGSTGMKNWEKNERHNHRNDDPWLWKDDAHTSFHVTMNLVMRVVFLAYLQGLKRRKRRMCNFLLS